jgi:hypothetical protein
MRFSTFLLFLFFIVAAGAVLVRWIAPMLVDIYYAFDAAT